MNEERFILKRWRDWFVIHRLVADHDFDPPLWVDRGELARFQTREDARSFMVARTEDR